MKLLLLLALVQLAICAPKKEQTAKAKLIKNNVGQVTKGTNTISKQIIGGQNAKLGQFPWHARIKRGDDTIVGGSLIRSQWVLTAAHCTKKFSTFEVTLGEVDQLTATKSRLTMITKTKIEHLNYNDFNSNYDIALLLLPEAVEFNAFIAPINLPLPSDAGKSFVDIQAAISGYGRTKDGGRSIKTLKYTILQVVSNEECKKSYESGVVLESTICAFQKNTSICNGDSGGALVYKNETTGFWVQIGIASFVPPKGCLVGPSGYARVTSFLEWIEDAIANEKDQSNSGGGAVNLLPYQPRVPAKSGSGKIVP